MSWLGKTAKSLFIFLFFFFFFSFLGLTTTKWSAGKYYMTLSQCHNSVMDGHVMVTVCHMTRVTWGPWESKHIAMVVKCISSREMSENSIKFSLSNSEQRDSWLNSSHWTLDADTRTRFHFRALSTLDLAHSLISFQSTLGCWSPRSVTTSIYSRALGLRGLCSQLGTAGGSVIPSLGIATETWPRNQAVFSSILVLFLV